MSASASTGRRRAQRLYVGDLGTCEECREAPAVDRHHRDRDTLNNDRANVMFVCRSCHSRLDEQGERLRGASQAKAERTHCIHGHELTPENTYERRDRKGRVCKRCRTDRQRARRAQARTERSCA